MPKISVIVPVYKVEKYLARCVDSVLSQTFTNFELILVDDGSPDNCPVLCDEYAQKDKRVVVIHKKNGGLSDARNAGIDWAFQNSDSEWLTFIDSDDWVHEKYLEILLNAAISTASEVSVGGFRQTTGDNIFETIDHVQPMLYDTENFYAKEMGTAVIACSKLYKKTLFATIRYPVGRLHEDEFTTYKVLFQTDKIAYIPTAIYAYYHNSTSITHSKWNPKRMEAYTAAEEQIEYFQAHGYKEAMMSVIRARFLLIETKLHLLKEQGKKDYLQIKAYRKVKKCFIKKYINYLSINNPYDEYVLSKIKPIFTKMRILCREIRKKVAKK